MKNKNRIINVVLIIIFSMTMNAALSGEDNEVVLDAAFFKNFSRTQIINRDELFANLTNKVVIGRGKITGISENERYKKKYRIIIESSDSGAYNQKIIFFVFLDNKDTVDLLSLNSKFEFKGPLMGYTPLNTKRSEYILDVIFTDGSTVIE